jgi:hypothetical protein
MKTALHQGQMSHGAFGSQVLAKERQKTVGENATKAFYCQVIHKARRSLLGVTFNDGDQGVSGVVRSFMGSMIERLGVGDEMRN